MTGKRVDSYFGRLQVNERRRKGTKDPRFVGWIDFPHGKASVAVWWNKELIDGVEVVSLPMTLKPWGNGMKRYSGGLMKQNLDLRANRAPHFIGSVEFHAYEYSVAGWIVMDELTGSHHMNLTARLVGLACLNDKIINNDLQSVEA